MQGLGLIPVTVSYHLRLVRYRELVICQIIKISSIILLHRMKFALERESKVGESGVVSGGW